MSSVAQFVFPELDYSDTNPQVEQFPGGVLGGGGTFSVLLRPPGKEAWRVISIVQQYSAIAAGGNRSFSLSIADADQRTFYTVQQSAVCAPAGTATLVYSIASSQVINVGSFGYAPLIDIVILPTWFVFLTTAAAVAGDTAGPSTMYRIEYSTTPNHSQSGTGLAATPVVL